MRNFDRLSARVDFSIFLLYNMDCMRKHKKDHHLQTIQELKEGWQRTQADFDNYQKRTEAEKLENIAFAKAEFMIKITPVLDNFRRAFEHKPTSTYEVEVGRYISGIKQIEKQLEDILLAEGLERIDTSGEFNPAFHEAISCEVNKKVPADHIIAELESGWMFGNKVLKPAKVRVSKGKKS